MDLEEDLFSHSENVRLSRVMSVCVCGGGGLLVFKKQISTNPDPHDAKKHDPWVF